MLWWLGYGFAGFVCCLMLVSLAVDLRFVLFVCCGLAGAVGVDCVTFGSMI